MAPRCGFRRQCENGSLLDKPISYASRRKRGRFGTMAQAVLADLTDAGFSGGAIIIARAGNINTSGGAGGDGERRIRKRRIALLSRGTGKTIIARNGLACAIRAATKPGTARGHGARWSALRPQTIGTARIQNGMTNVSHGTIRVDGAEFPRRNAATQ